MYEIVTEDDMDPPTRESRYDASPLWIIQSILTALLSIFGLIAALKLDKNDQKNLNLAKTAPTLTLISKENHFISEVSKVLNEPYSSLMHR